MGDDTRSVPPRTLGKTGPVVAAVALGCSSMSGLTGAGADDEVAAGTIRAAVDQGVDLIDTADFYGLGHNESLIARALTGVPRGRYLLSDKFGGLRDPSGAFLGTDCRPATLKTFLAYADRLGVRPTAMIFALALDRNHRDTGMPCQYGEVARSRSTRVRTSGLAGLASGTMSQARSTASQAETDAHIAGAVAARAAHWGPARLAGSRRRRATGMQCAPDALPVRLGCTVLLPDAVGRFRSRRRRT